MLKNSLLVVVARQKKKFRGEPFIKDSQSQLFIKSCLKKLVVFKVFYGRQSRKVMFPLRTRHKRTLDWEEKTTDLHCLLADMLCHWQERTRLGLTIIRIHDNGKIINHGMGRIQHSATYNDSARDFTERWTLGLFWLSLPIEHDKDKGTSANLDHF